MNCMWNWIRLRWVTWRLRRVLMLQGYMQDVGRALAMLRPSTPLTLTSVNAVFKDRYPAPGQRIKQYVVDEAREDAWERETCPRIDVLEHLDDDRRLCGNVGMPQWNAIPGVDCRICMALHMRAHRINDGVRSWIAMRSMRSPICSDREKLSDETAPDVSLVDHPFIKALRAHKGTP